MKTKPLRNGRFFERQCTVNWHYEAKRKCKKALQNKLIFHGELEHDKADVLKIDMSFLQEIKDSERNRIILKSVISMANSLGMDVITEGIETEEQLHELAELGCNHFQGFFFCRPIPVDDFEKKYITTI